MMNTTARHTRTRSKNRTATLSAGLLALFLFYFAGGALFTHAHRFNNATVVHSHYYAHPWRTAADARQADASRTDASKPDAFPPGATPSHSHSSEQFKTIQHLDYILFVAAAIGMAVLVFQPVSSVAAPQSCACPTAERPHFPTRGPPAGI